MIVEVRETKIGDQPDGEIKTRVLTATKLAAALWMLLTKASVCNFTSIFLPLSGHLMLEITQEEAFLCCLSICPTHFPCSMVLLFKRTLIFLSHIVVSL